MIYRNIYLYRCKLFKIKLFEKKYYENGLCVVSVKIGHKTKTKKKGQDAVTSSNKIFFLVKNEIIYRMQKIRLVYIFSS